jgi:hypothetical protein
MPVRSMIAIGTKSWDVKTLYGVIPIPISIHGGIEVLWYCNWLKNTTIHPAFTIALLRTDPRKTFAQNRWSMLGFSPPRLKVSLPPPGGFYFQDQQSWGIFRRGGGRIQSSIPIHPDHQQTAYHQPHHWASGFFERCAEEYPLHLKGRRITPANCCLFVHRFIHRAASFYGNGTCGD